MLYCKDEQSYDLEKCMWKHSEEWQQILFNVMQLKLALLYNKDKQHVKIKEIDIQAIMLDVVENSISIFDKFLTNIKGYKKQPIIDNYDNTDITLYQDLDYKVVFKPFEDFFNNIEVE